MNIFNKKETSLILAHRGASTKAAENTMKAFNLCVENSFDGIEFDVQLSKDDQLVIIHDFDLKRLANLDAKVRDLTYQELLELEIKTEYGTGKIPLLEDLFKKHTNKLYYDIELKAPALDNDILCIKCWQLIRKYSLEEYCMVSSFNPFVVRSFNKISKRAIPTAVIYSLDKEVPLLFRRGFGRFIAKSTHLKPHYELVNPKIFKRLTKKGFPIITWTVDNLEEGKKFLEMGLLAIITNDVEIYR